MAQAARLRLRMQKELKLLLADPPYGASFPFLSPQSDISDLSSIDAQIKGPEGTVYANGIFKIKIQIPERYPLQPPIVTFGTPVYHPNIDTGGRICLDILNLPPKGAWQPSLNISTVLMSIGLLLSEPNPDDGLMCEASREYKYNRQAFEHKARSMTEKYAKAGAGESSCSNQCNTNSMMEVQEGLDIETKIGAKEFVPGQKKPHGISQKLSLESTSSNKKKDSDEEINEMPNHHSLPSDVGNQLEGKRKREKENDVLNECNPNKEKLDGNRQKSSLKLSNKFKDDFDNKENVDPNYSSLCQRQASTRSNKKKYSGQEVHEMPNHHSLPSDVGNQLEGKREREEENDVLNEFNLNKEKLDGNKQKSSLQLSNKFKDDFDNKENIDPNYSSLNQHQASSGSSLVQAQQLDRHQDGKSAKSSIKRSSKLCQSQKLPFGSLQTSINAKMHQTPPEEFADGIENVSANITSDKKPGLVGKKLSLGLKGSSLGQLASNKEKVISIDKLPLLKPPGERLLGPKLPLGPSSQVQQDCRPHQKLQSNQVQSMETIVEIKQKGVEETEESLITETIVVLDSEDSEGEEPCSSRSRMPLVARKRLGKWRVKP